ncbi:hypothetical protein JCM6882_008433 [Rhodosporidiobolus microsporus]
MVDYRGATVEDLQLSPALVLPVSTSVGTALQLAFERDFSILPLHAPHSRASLLGYLSIEDLKPLASSGAVDMDAPLSALAPGLEESGEEGGGKEEGGPVKGFRRERRYQVITPSTPLEDLDAFFSTPQGGAAGFALVTDGARKFVLGLVTREDLQKFTTRRFPAANSPETTTVGLPPSSSATATGTAAGRQALVV